ncbi:chemotaxis protein [Paenibacillus radicis (ex Gao et al. 2016)]|uniref:Chemotaxis protein n=2 Tax=Paenibacillus radicis (ex Gao et al. 2016) TaxID=1737354 RepID=A0A917HN33_9BACL|nr:chemotaxis protein [Paenibacillus radicis (ex Gao et al. 2016)]
MKNMGKKNKEKNTTSTSSLKAQTLGDKGASLAKSSLNALKETKLTSPVKSVGMKLFFIIFISIIACVLAVGQLAYSQSKKIVERKVSEASYQTIVQATDNLNTIFKTYEDISMQILIDKDFHKLAEKIADSKDDYTTFEGVKELGDKLQNYVMGNDAILGVYLFPVDPKVKLVTAGSASASAAEAMVDSEWFKAIQEQKGRTYWVETQPGGFGTGDKQATIGLGRLMNDSNLSKARYMILLEISLDRIQEQYRDIQLGEGSQISIVDENNNYIANSDASLIGKPQNIKLPETENDSLKLKSTSGEDVLAAYAQFKSMNWKLVGTIPVKELVKDAAIINKMTWITVGLAALLAIAIGLLVIRTIAIPLVQLRNLMNEGERGNLTVRSAFKKRQDEIGQLGESFNKMMTQITALAKQTTLSAEEVLATASELTDASKKTAISAREISVATEEIANGASSLAVEAERGSDLTGNINMQMRTVMDANGEMVESAGDVEKASQQGTAYMGVLIEKTGMTEEMTRSMVEKVDSLKESTGSIVKILDVLNNLTKQTNILSLNATIEAARAGAAGKGFMVVADEIRKLADQSRQSIDIVAQITERISGEIEETVQVLSEAYPLFQEQIGSVKEANQIFLTVQSQMGQFVQKLDSVTGSIGMLDQSQSVLSEAMTNVSAVAQQSSATSEEVASLSTEQLSISNGLVNLSERLDSVSRQLKDSLAKFKID